MDNKRACTRRGKSRLIGPINAGCHEIRQACAARALIAKPGWNFVKADRYYKGVNSGPGECRWARCCTNELGRAARKYTTWLIQLNARPPARSRQDGGRHFARIINLNAKLLPEEAARWLSGWSAVGAVHNYAFLVVLRRAPAGCLKRN